MHCYSYGSVAAKDYPATPGNVQYKRCDFPASVFSSFGIVNGGTYNFDIHTVGTMLYEGINCPNCQPLLSAPVSGPGLNSNFVSVETTATSSSQPGNPALMSNMGSLVNIGMYTYSWIVKEYYSMDNGNSWTEFPPTSSSAQIIGANSTTLGVGNDLYCDRPNGSEAGFRFNGYQSGFIDSSGIRGFCD